MLPTERISYSPIATRPPLKLPNGARMAVWVIVNVEEWDAKQTMPRTVLTPPAGGSPQAQLGQSAGASLQQLVQGDGGDQRRGGRPEQVVEK